MAYEYKLFGLTFRLEVVVICVVLGIVIGANLFCNSGLRFYEGLENEGDAEADAEVKKDKKEGMTASDKEKKEKKH
jgi:hypothetical protein